MADDDVAVERTRQPIQWPCMGHPICSGYVMSSPHQTPLGEHLMTSNVETPLIHPTASWPMNCSPGAPGWHFILRLVNEVPTVTLAEARGLLSARDKRLRRFGPDDTLEDYGELLRDEPDEARLYDVIRRRAAAGDAQAERLMEQFRSSPLCFPGSVLARAAADRHPGWKKTYRHLVADDDRCWDATLCRKIGDGPADGAELISWFRETHPAEATEAEAHAVDVLLGDWAIEAYAEARIERERQIEAERLQKDEQAGRADCVMIIVKEFENWVPVIGPEDALVAALQKVPDATISEVARAL